MTLLKTKNTKASRELLGMLDVPPASQKSNWENNLIPYFINRLKEWNGGMELEGGLDKNYQYANLLIKNKFLHEYVLLRKCPFPRDMAVALEWTLAAADEVPETKAKCTNFNFIYKNFEKIMRREKI